MGWAAEGRGVESTDCRIRRAGRRAYLVHRADASALADAGHRYDALTFIDVLEHIPDPDANTGRGATRVIVAGGLDRSEGAQRPGAGFMKETWRARLIPGYRATVADNLVHVNHFSPHTCLAAALLKAGFVDSVHVEAAAPEIVQPNDAPMVRRHINNAMRRLVYFVARVLPGGVHTPLTLHLQGIRSHVPHE